MTLIFDNTGFCGHITPPGHPECADRLTDFAPQLFLTSAGFDAHADDPLAGLNWRAGDSA